MTEEERIYQEILSKSTAQGGADVQAQKEAEKQNQITEILNQQSSQLAAEAFINQAKVSIETLPNALVTYVQQNVVQNTRKSKTEFSDNFKQLLLFCCNLPQYIAYTVQIGGELPISNMGVPDPALLHIVEEAINNYLEQNYKEEGLQAKFIIPEMVKPRLDGMTPHTVYKPADGLRLSIQREKVK